MVHAVNDSVRRILGELESLRLDRRTVVIFTSDNGGLESYVDNRRKTVHVTTNEPLRGGKGQLYEGGIRVPLIVRYPGVVAAGSRSATPVSSVDLAPTILDLAGAPATALPRADGRSIVPLLTEKGEITRDGLFWHYPHYNRQGGMPSGAVREGRHKLLEFSEEGRLELYDLHADPGEQIDLAAGEPALTERLHGKLTAWRASVAAQMPSLNPDHDASRETEMTGPPPPPGMHDQITSEPQ